jgi:predicted transposase YbfD/YdcC
MASDVEALLESVVFLEHFSDLPDPRQLIKVMYPLDEVLLLSLLAVLAGAETFTDIARFGEKKLDLLRRFRPFLNKTPTHDRLGEIFAALDAERFQQCFVAWVAAHTGIPAEVIAIDGKTSRRSFQKKGDAPIHIVSAFAARQRLVLGQVAVAEKSNEIVAIPKLLDMLVIEGAIVTIDAMGCQRTIARKVIDKKADYVLALKGNQGSLHNDVQLFVAEQRTNSFRNTTISEHNSVDGDHGRIETRHTTVIHDVEWLQNRHDWPGLNAVIILDSERETGTKTERETRFYLTSSNGHAAKLAAVVRDHWAVENSLHWVMDMVFRDDECRISTGHAPANFTTVKHIAQNLMRRSPTRDSMRLKRKVAAWDDEFLVSLIAQ